MSVVTGVLDEIGLNLMFLRELMQSFFHRPCRFKDVVDQIWSVTLASMPTTVMSGFFVGAILAVQFTMQMKDFGALGYLGGLATSGTIREVGPLLIAFMLSGKVGAFTSAELGTMRVTEQIDAIRCLGADPIQEIILPRFIGIVISSALLLGMGLVASVAGGALMGHLFAGVSVEEYLRHIPTILVPASIGIGFFKCLVFAVVLATVCTRKGYQTTGGAKGVGRAVVATAVSTMICIVMMDWVTSYLAEAVLNWVKEL